MLICGLIVAYFGVFLCVAGVSVGLLCGLWLFLGLFADCFGVFVGLVLLVWLGGVVLGVLWRSLIGGG